MRTTVFIFASSIILFLYSCTNETITQSTENNRVFGHLENISRTLFIPNGNFTDTHWVENDSIGLFTSAQQNILYKALSSGKNTEFEAENTKLIFDENNRVTAYYPYTDSIEGNNVKLPNTTNIKNTDPKEGVN